MTALIRPVKWLYNTLGLAAVHHAGRDAWLVILGRSCRMSAYGAASLIIALFFSSLSFSDSQIGLFMTLTLLGDVALSLLLTLVADGLGRRRVLLGGAVLMVASGAVFALLDNFWVLLAAAVVGVVSATGSDAGPFRAIEESTLAHLTTAETRPDVMSWYVVASSLGLAAGTEVSGWIVELLRRREGWNVIDAYHAVFWLYVAMGLVNVGLTLGMSERCETVERANARARASDEVQEGLLDGEEQPKEEEEEDKTPTPNAEPLREKKSRFARVSSATRSTMYKLWFLLTVDCLADGMTSLPLTSYYFDRKFNLSKSTLGTITSVSYFLATGSSIFAGPLSRTLGLIKTMVFTHLPSSAAVLFFPAPHSLWLTVTLFLIRMGLNNMDQAPRAAFIAAVVKPEERTAVMGITNTLRTSASTIGPSITGLLAGHERFWIAFVGAGSLRILYDLGLWGMFVNAELQAHEPLGQGVSGRRRESDEEEEEMVALESVGRRASSMQETWR